MISSISSSMSSSMVQHSNSSQQHRPPGKDAFQVADTDGDGLVADTELSSVVAGIAETTGTKISTEDALSAYDANDDGGLSGEEMLAMLTTLGLMPSMGANGEAEGPPPPPPPSSEQALASYAENSGEDLITALIDNLQNIESDSMEEDILNIIS